MPYPPRQLNIKLLDRCNAACSFCGYNRDRLPKRIAAGYEPQQVDLKALIRRFPEIRAKGIGILHLTGGEPTLHPDFIDFVRAAKTTGFSVRTGTNGSMLDEERVRALAEARIDYLWYSLDAFPFEAHLRHRGFLHLRDRMERGIGLLMKHRVNVFAQTVLSRVLPWKEEAPDLAGHVSYYRKEFGFRRFVFSYPMHEEGAEGTHHLAREGGEAVNFTRPELAGMLSRLAAFKETPEGRGVVNPRASLRAQIRELEGSESGIECRAGRDLFFLGEDGESLRPCYHLSSVIVDRLDGRRFREDDRFRNCKSCRDQCFRDPSLLYEAARAPLRFARASLAIPGTLRALAADAGDLVRHGGYARA